MTLKQEGLSPLKSYVGDTMKKDKKVFDTCHPSKAGAKCFGDAFMKDAAERKIKIASIFK